MDDYDEFLQRILGEIDSSSAPEAPVEASQRPELPPWPGDKLRKKIEAEARRRRCQVHWIREAQWAGDVLIDLKQYWKFVKPPKVKKAQRPRCNAVCRGDGHHCQARCVEGRNRCRMHGGLSTGPKSVEGRAAIAESNRKRAKRD